MVDWARAYADKIETDMKWNPGDMGHGWWSASDEQSEALCMARAAAALEFFHRYAGEGSGWDRRARAMVDSNGGNRSPVSGVRGLAPMLREWANQVDAGVLGIVGAEESRQASLAGTDLMEQVRRLNADRDTHPAAPIMLCGAALEMRLRATAIAFGIELGDRPTLGEVSGLLRSRGIITAQDSKDFTQLAGIRNQAAHGDFDALSRERAGLMEQQTNLMLRRLDELEAVHSPDDD